MRDRYLREQGYCVLRFWNNDVLSNIEGVLSLIDEELRKTSD
jgi:very-short-patch-repair endonuclease